MELASSTDVADRLAAIAEEVLSALLCGLPAERTERFVLFMEATRLLDYWAIFRGTLPEIERPSLQDAQMIEWGWNLAAAHLFSPLDSPGFPLAESTLASRRNAGHLLHLFGRVNLLRRASQMVRHGLLISEATATGLSLKMNDSLSFHFLDTLDMYRMTEMEAFIAGEHPTGGRGWTAFDLDNPAAIQLATTSPGSFFGQRTDSVSNWRRADIEDLMVPLIRPWPTSRGVMMAYDARPEVDSHFLEVSLQDMKRCYKEAGIHGTIKLGGISVERLVPILVALRSFVLKHGWFAIYAARHVPDISIAQSVTVWGPRKDLEDSIEAATGLMNHEVRSAVDAICVTARDLPMLQERTSPMKPLLIDLGNGYLLKRPSGALANPLLAVRALAEWRDPHLAPKIASPREEWFRTELYQMFQGKRYECIPGTIKLRDDGVVVTDIDAAIWDRTTGELALFQLKWQDYFTNNIRELRSKAGNFVREMNEWAEKTSSYVSKTNSVLLARTLRLKVRGLETISHVYLFGLSRHMARAHSYGYQLTNPKLVICNWAQFARVRFEVGPATRVFGRIHVALQSEFARDVSREAFPYELEVGGISIVFEDLFSGFEEVDGEKRTAHDSDG